jgi:hypothetical protein
MPPDYLPFTPRRKGDTVKSFMKNRSGTYGKTRENLPLEGGGKRVGVKGLTRDVLLTPHPDPLPQGERGGNF